MIRAADVDEHVDAGHDSPERLATRAVRIFALSGFVVAQPLFDVLGGGVAFFIAHDASRGKVLLFVALVLAVPPAVLLLVIEAIGVRSASVKDALTVLLLSGLAGITIASAIDRWRPLPLWIYAAALGALTLTTAIAYIRLSPVRTFCTFLAPAPLLFAGVFLFVSPASALVLAGDPDVTLPSNTDRVDVLVVVFDELPLGALLEPSGELDGERFPGFARLAASSTWYPNTSTVAPQTTAAVPALLTGRYPTPGDVDSDAVPLAIEHPRSLFTLLGGTHEMQVYEWVTRLCPRNICGDRDGHSLGIDGRRPSMLQDVLVVAGHQLLPERAAVRLLPSLSGRWAGFADAEPMLASSEQTAERLRRQDMPRTAFDEALGGLVGLPRAQLWFTHERLPHRPPTRLPDGTSYPRSFGFDWRSNLRPDASMVYRQRFLLQVKYVDTLVDRLLDEIEEQGLEEAILVVTADHGLSFQPHGSPRAMATDNQNELSDVMPVPLFIRYAGQREGRVDERETQLVDVLATIVDALGIELPDDWHLDGRSLLSGDVASRPLVWQPLGPLPPELSALDATQFAQESHVLLGPYGGRHDLYGLGPHRSMVGQTPAPGEAITGVVLDVMHDAALADVNLDSGRLPAFYEATVVGLEPGAWVAVTLNGIVAGTGPVLDVVDEPARVKVMLDPTLFVGGTNDAELLLIDGDVLRPVLDN